MKELSIGKILNINNEYQRYCGAYNELAERDIDYDWFECLDTVKSFARDLQIEDKFDWESIAKDLGNGDLDAHDAIFNIEDQIGMLLNQLIYGYIYGGKKNGN